MAQFFAFIFLVFFIASIVYIVKLVLNRKDKVKTKTIKTRLYISLILAGATFVATGISAPRVEKDTNADQQSSVSSESLESSSAVESSSEIVQSSQEQSSSSKTESSKIESSSSSSAQQQSSTSNSNTGAMNPAINNNSGEQPNQSKEESQNTTYTTTEQTTKQDYNNQTNGKIVGNVKSKIYHVPGGKSYNKISGSNAVFFDTEEEAQKAGYRRARN